MIRLFEFKNSFMRKNAKAVPAKYSSIGYFDGLDMTKFEDEEMILSEPIRIDQLENQECDFFSMTGMREKENDDFWNESLKPYLFVSFLRLEKASKNLESIVAEIERQFNACCYYTIDSSDLIICLKTNSYAEGYRNIEKGYRNVISGLEKKENEIKKIYSIVSLEQHILDNIKENPSGITDEKISCYLSCVVKNWDKVNEFKEALKTALHTEKAKRYGILGSDDVVIELKDIKILDLLALFGNSELLVHDNDKYKVAFHNIKTQILVEQQ